jgi:hypothetical protein
MEHLMSAEILNEEAVQPLSGVDGKEVSSSGTVAKTEQPPKPMTASEKLCLNVSVLAVILTILYVTGFFTNLPAFMALSLEERPVRTFFVSALAAGIATWMLSWMMPRQVAVLACSPAFLFFGFWLSSAWAWMIAAYPATLDGSAATWVFIATLIPGFCLSLHWFSEKDNPSISARIEVFAWTVTLVNGIALLLTFLITTTFIESVKGEFEATINSEAIRHERLSYIFSGCPIVKSQKYCEALKVISSEE